MKEKYLILNNDDQKELIIRKFAELDDKEALLLLAEEKYDVKDIKSAMKKGEKALISVLRTQNLYPPCLHAGKIAEAAISMSGEKKQPIELLFDDIDLLTKKKSKPEPIKEVEKESNEIDELLEGEFAEELNDNLKKTLIIKDDNSLDIDG